MELLPKYISGSNVLTRLEEQEDSEARTLCEMQTWLFQIIIYYRTEWDESDISNIKKSIEKLEEANISTILLLLGLWSVDPKTADLKKCSSLILSGLFSSRYHEVISAIDAIKFWWKLGNLNIMEPAGEEIISALLRKIESKNDPGLANAILALIDLTISEPKDFITEGLKPQINFALEILYAELGPLKSITDFWEKIYRSPYEFDENQFPHIRYLASRFAFYYGKLFSRANEPSIINLWRQLSVNDNLPEIRAMWRDDR
ncbi:MAG: hypothetical protein IPP17_31445 [Bacteroidetes bacterium]|nr:hypothetical protein [Bacteroidota bacterium]